MTPADVYVTEQLMTRKNAQIRDLREELERTKAALIISEASARYWQLRDTDGSHPDTLIITPQTYRTMRHHRDLADRIMTEHHLAAIDITEMRISEGRIEIDQLWRGTDGRVAFVDGEPDIRTMRITPR